MSTILIETMRDWHLNQGRRQCQVPFAPCLNPFRSEAIRFTFPAPSNVCDDSPTDRSELSKWATQESCGNTREGFTLQGIKEHLCSLIGNKLLLGAADFFQVWDIEPTKASLWYQGEITGVQITSIHCHRLEVLISTDVPSGAQLSLFIQITRSLSGMSPQRVFP